jgi:hypothetical protein
MKTPPAPTIATTFSPTSIQCGSNTPVTFTANVNNAPGITGYTWNLGSSNNGWLYNGNSAPQTISTGINSIILTPSCGMALSSVSATMAVGGSNYTSIPSTVPITQPTLSIAGGNALSCDPVVYSIAGLPCNATVIWSSSDLSVANPIPNGNNCTMTPLKPGKINLSAIVTLPCGGSSVTYIQPITVQGKYQVLGTSCTQSFNIMVVTPDNNSGQPIELNFSIDPLGAATIAPATSGFPLPQLYGSYYTVTRANGFMGQFKIFAQKANGLSCESTAPFLTSSIPAAYNCTNVQTCTTVIPLCPGDFNKGFAFSLPPLPIDVYPDVTGWNTDCYNCTVQIVNGKYYAIPNYTGQSTNSYTAVATLAFPCPNTIVSEPVKWIPNKINYFFDCSSNPNYPDPITGYSITVPEKLTVVKEITDVENTPVNAVTSQTVIFPNPPNSSEITISFKQLNVKTPTLKTLKGDEIRIETLTGHTLSVTPITSNASQIKINIANVANGIYLVKITRGTTVEIQKLIIVK